MEKKFIKDYSLEEINSLFQSLGEKEYRSRQLLNWLYEKNVHTFLEMTNFSKSLRSELEQNYILSPLEVIDRRISPIDGTEKYLLRTYDNHFIETVLIKNDGTDEGRLTICISSQIGCAMGCDFCQTGKLGFFRNLSTGEIIDQICHVRRMSGLRNNNIVFMGMGEPFMNYDNVLKAADIMNYTFGFHLSARKITISTSGITPAIERFIDEKRVFNLAISLNDTEPAKRMAHMPIQKKYPIKEIAELLNKKFPHSRNRVTIEYIMRKDNISNDDARRLKKMFKYSRIKLNLIPLNPGDHNLEIPTEKEIAGFIQELEIMNIPVSIRKSAGSDIMGACGQLSGIHYDKTERLVQGF